MIHVYVIVSITLIHWHYWTSRIAAQMKLPCIMYTCAAWGLTVRGWTHQPDGSRDYDYRRCKRICKISPFYVALSISMKLYIISMSNANILLS